MTDSIELLPSIKNVERAHDEAHAAEPPVRFFQWHDDILVRAASNFSSGTVPDA